MRLAERQGLLTGRHLTPVQSTALEMLLLIDAKEKQQAFWKTFRSRMAAAHPGQLRTLFPEWFSGEEKAKEQEEEFERARNTDGSYDIDKIDPTKVEWTVPATDAEREELERWINLRSAGTVTAGELEGDGWV